jgi:hypothetical protein
MPKITIRTSNSTTTSGLPPGCSGDGQADVYFSGADRSLHLHRVILKSDDRIRFTSDGPDRLGYVWQGSVVAGGIPLECGSSLIVEQGAELDLAPTSPAATLLLFAGTVDPLPGGGQVHLLPASQAPRCNALGGVARLGGVMHADADLSSCSLWLHENHFPPESAGAADDEASVHSHSEDEIIFVIGGEIRLGAKLYGPGTALAIAANTLYSFSGGPQGLAFINFRAGKPGDIRFANGHSMSETLYWRERLPRPQYLSPEF